MARDGVRESVLQATQQSKADVKSWLARAEHNRATETLFGNI
jgi:hypothetical protein